MRKLAFVLLCTGVMGCGSGGSQPAFADLHPVKGVVKRNGQPVKGGQIVFTHEADKEKFGVNSVVGADGTFNLTTYRTTDKTGERKQGAPAGTYQVLYVPDIGDQTSGGAMEPVNIATPVVVKAGTNDLTIDLPPKK